MERLANDKELKKWRQFEREFDRFTQLFYLTTARALNAAFAQNLAVKYKVAFPLLEQSEKDFFACRSWYLKTRDLIRGVEEHTLGITFSDNDVNIVKTQEQGELKGWFIPILVVAGVALLIGAIADTLRQRKKLEEVEKAFKGATDFADKRFCADPASPLCAEWKQTKNLEQYRSNETIIDRLSKAVSETGAKISSGLGVGLAIAVPLILWSWFGKRAKT